MNPNFDKAGGLIPAIVQDTTTGQVLMQGYMNAEALEITEQTGKVTFYSRSRQQLWTKGETSGNFLIFDEYYLDCDRDSILVKARPTGPVCHTGSQTCFKQNESEGFLYQLQSIIQERRDNPSESSYTNHLFSRGYQQDCAKSGRRGH